MKPVLLLVLAVFAVCRTCDAQNIEAAAPHNCLEWKNLTIMSTAAGGHVWAAKEYNGQGHTSTEVMEVTYQQKFNFRSGYIYAKEFSQMSAVTLLSYIYLRSNHHKLERWFFGGGFFRSGWIWVTVLEEIPPS
jgi:hypothetical protein